MKVVRSDAISRVKVAPPPLLPLLIAGAFGHAFTKSPTLHGISKPWLICGMAPGRHVVSEISCKPLTHFTMSVKDVHKASVILEVLHGGVVPKAILNCVLYFIMQVKILCSSPCVQAALHPKPPAYKRTNADKTWK